MYLRKVVSNLKLGWAYRLLEKYPHLEEFGTFCIIGVFNTVFDVVLYWFFTRIVGFHFILGNTCSFAIVTSLSFFLNKKFTFQHKGTDIHKQYVKFFIVTGIGLLWNNLIIYTLVSYAGIYDMYGKLMAVGVVMFWNYGMNKFWSFRNKEGSRLVDANERTL